MHRLIEGPALVMGDNVNTDMLHPSRFFSLDDSTVRSGFMQAAANFEQTGQSDLKGRVILAGVNFGCGSSRETGARVFVLAGIQAIVARSVARIFGRNLRNLGVPVLECPSLPAGLTNDAFVRIDRDRWNVAVDSSIHPLKPIDPYWKAVVDAGGLMPFLGFPAQ